MDIYKIGSSCLADTLRSALSNRMDEVKDRESTILLVSGAVALGRAHLGVDPREEVTNTERQIFASIGQPYLFETYQKMLHPRKSAQIVETYGDLTDKSNNISEVIRGLLERRVIPIINYNDPVNGSEARLDNDVHGARLLQILGSDRLIIAGSSYEGMVGYDGKVLRRIHRVSQEHYDLCKGKSESGVGGFETKLDAMKIVLSEGKEGIIGNIGYSLQDLIDGKAPRTLFKK